MSEYYWHEPELDEYAEEITPDDQTVAEEEDAPGGVVIGFSGP
ncbi:MAG TPA: hypothetical protein VGQ48_05115 [Gemmatimonadales bacterium]|nr:hypothetical protein [Gemmatimonadales bacterium]